ncbi:MAG TPA: protein-disulfide reductase DsbD N-terminal domain-containing protein [Pyrinomonadaceae bacterium]|nr:protein-disulfide reductase DsbD N-terminal domain-containing protein [Pyrinomonadaceae bacterium]
MMRNRKYTRRTSFILLAIMMLALPASFQAATAAASPAAQANIGINGFFSSDKAQLGRTLQAAVVLDIPSGFHINSNRPLAKFLIPTSLKIEAPGGIRVGAVSYPRAVIRSFSFSPDKLSVYEGRAVLRFNVTVPNNFQTGVTELRVRVKYQSCNDEACFPPTTRTISMPIAVVGANESSKRINGKIFGGGRRG